MNYIYECCKEGKDINKSPTLDTKKQTEAEAIKWLENNGGGIYRNSLHNFQFFVEEK